MHSQRPTFPTAGEEEDDDDDDDDESEMFPGNPPPEFRILIPGLSYALDKRCIARRSARIARMLEEGDCQQEQGKGLVFPNLTDAPPSPAGFELAAKFCYGYSPELSPENILSVVCVSSYLEMTEDHSPDNLLHQALSFFSAAVLPHWNESLRCLRGGTAAVLPHAAALGLIAALLNSISGKVLQDPLRLCNPLEESQPHRAKRRLFDDWLTEDLTDLNLELFLMAIAAVSAAGAPPSAVARCIHRYARRKARVGTSTPSEDYEKNSHKRILEALEQLLPTEKTSLQIKPLLQMLQAAMALGSSKQCRTGLEQRIGALLSEASVEDILISAQGYARETEYDVDCVERVVAHFCAAAGGGGGSSPEVGKVAALFEGYLAAAAAERGLRKEKFSRLLRMLAWLLEKGEKSGDGVYRAVDLYFFSHGELTESEREEICRGALDCRRLSAAMCEQAAQNERMPLRVVAQVLYVGQMHIREAIAGAMKDEEEEGEGSERGMSEKGDERGTGKKVEEREEEVAGEEREVGCVGCEDRRKKKGFGLWRKFVCRDVRSACGCSLRKVKVHRAD